MNAQRIGTIGLGLVLAIALSACRGMPHQAPPIHPNPNMDNVTRCEAQESTTLFADGRCMREPPANTIYRGGLRQDEHLYEGLVNGGYATELPRNVVVEITQTYRSETEINDELDAPLTAEVLDRGQARYGIYCAPCHGDAGQGNGTVPTRVPTWVVPTFHDETRQGYPVGRIFEVISEGYSTMPAYAAQIPVNDRWAISAYVRALQLSQSMTADMAPGDVASQQGWE